MFEKLDAYNIMANLVPGAALTYALFSSHFPAPNPEALGSFLLISFIAGVTTNRIGSLLIDPILRSPKISFLKQKDYAAFVDLEREDKKLETLVANAGLYRTFFTAGCIYLILIIINDILDKICLSYKNITKTFVFIGMIVFIFALKKRMDIFIHELSKRVVKIKQMFDLDSFKKLLMRLY